MSTITDKAITLDMKAKDKIKFVASVIPILGLFGGVLRVNGYSEEAALIVVVPLLIVAMFLWRIAVVMRDMPHGSEDTESQLRDMRGTQLPLEGAVVLQQNELREIRGRQHAEQERLIREHASADQLARMMERHRSEYEALFSSRRSA